MDFKGLFRLNTKFINAGGYIKYLLNCVLHRNLISVVKKNSSLCNYRNSDTCYICALGPSLKTVDLSRLQGDTIVVNRFFKLGKDNPEFVPTFYLMIDALFAKAENLNDFQEALRQYSNRGTVYLLHSRLESIVQKMSHTGKYFYLSCFKGMFNHTREFRIDRVMPAFGNVACTAIACAMALGYKKIILLGCDFNSFASRSNVHCYSENKQERLHKMSYELFCYSFNADMHDELQAYALKHDIKIINSSKGSLIDAYPYVINETLYKQ